MQTNYNLWVKLIKWSNAHDPDPTRRWNGFQAFLVTERGRSELINEWNKKRHEQNKQREQRLDDITPLEGDELEEAKGFWEKGTDFSQIDEIDFQSVQFYAEANFQNATFSQKANFQNATFSKDAHFKNTQFFHDAIFVDSKFHQKAIFKGAKFSKNADFGCGEDKIIREVDFSDAVFETHPPEFYERKLHEYTDFGFKSLPAVPEKEVSTEEKKEASTEEKTDDILKKHIRSYENLRVHAEKLGMIEARRRFVRHELACRTADCENWGEWFVRGLYGLISDYGTSMWRPLIALGALWGVFWGIFRMLSVTDCCEPLPFNLVNGLTFTFAHIIPFTAGKIDFPALEAWNCAPSFQFWAIILSLLSYILLFLLSLALSSKFRMKV